nr:hypothetical protein CFP56_26919 [Quercus suber]
MYHQPFSHFTGTMDGSVGTYPTITLQQINDSKNSTETLLEQEFYTYTERIIRYSKGPNKETMSIDKLQLSA